MPEAVPPPEHDPLDGPVPEADRHRPYRDLVVALMETWDVSKPEAERRMEQYTLEQCEWLALRRWGAV